MPNHFHLLIKADLKELASFMAIIIAEFAKYYNQKHNRVGYVFQDRYRSQCVENIGYFWNCLRYIHNNPLYLKDVEKKFGDPEELLKFHKIGSWDTFEDISEEAKENKLRIAREILAQFETDYSVEGIEVLDYIKIRHEFRKILIKTLHIPVRETDEIINILREEIKKRQDKMKKGTGTFKFGTE